MNIQFRDLIYDAPNSPGIYKMYDADGLLLYIGKARDINARLKQYIDVSKLEPHKQVMRGLVVGVIWEITKNESDALILEQDLIKREKPKYNIMLTDGKMYPQLALTAHEFPRLLKFRGRISQKRDVYGPYPSVSALNETIKTIQKSCKIRTCTDSFMNNRTRPCLLYQIGRCSAPCTIAQTHYDENIKIARQILSGKSEVLITGFKAQMKELSDNMEFEAAAIMRDRISALTHTSARGVKYKTSTDIAFANTFGELSRWLGLNLSRVAVFDNSHLFGKTPVGAMIIFGPNGFIKSDYRSFKLRDNARAGNDIAMMDEFIGRAIARDKNIDLIITDGGPAQYNIAKKTAGQIPVLGITKGVVRNGDEHFIMPNGTENHDLDKDSALFLFLRRVRDAAHQHAISFHRARHTKKMTASILDEIDGIGAARKRAVLGHFGSVKQIAAAGVEELELVSGLGKSAAKKIYLYFHP